MIEERNEKKEFVLNEKVLEVFVDDRCFNGSYVWYDVLECLCARSYLLQSTRVFMALMMGAVMAVIMLLFMWKMYENKKINVMILAASLLVFAGSLFMVRSQTTVNDTAWMKAMIPHHSIAILTSKRADLKDPEVKKLAEEIIQAQEEEIDKMKKMIKEME